MKTVLIYSGGLDSTVLLYDLLAGGGTVLALSVDYGQRHRVEIEHARRTAESLGVEWQLADLSGTAHLLACSSLTRAEIAVPHGHYAEASMKQTVVPNRNMIMLAVAAGWAIGRQADRVAYAAHAGDHTIYPDCRPEFAAAVDRAFPARLLDLLNQQDDSPLRGLISTPTTPTGVIKDNSILKMLEHSLSDGVLFRFCDPDGDDVDSMFGILKNFWQAVQQIFKTAWGLPPNKSRLMHDAGVVSLGFLMDAIADRHRHLRIPPVDVFAADLLPLRDECRWTDGYWDFGPGAQPKWNEIQNTTRDIQVLSNHLLVRYKALVWNRPMAQTGSGTAEPSKKRAGRKTG